MLKSIEDRLEFGNIEDQETQILHEIQVQSR